MDDGTAIPRAWAAAHAAARSTISSVRLSRAFEDQHARLVARDPVDARQVLVRRQPPGDAEVRQRVDEQPQRAAVERRRAEHLVARAHERQHGRGHRGHARGERERRLGALDDASDSSSARTVGFA